MVEYHLLHVGLFVAATLVFVPWFGLIGYGVAELATFFAFALIHLRVKNLFSVSYRRPLPWLIGFAPALFMLFVPSAWGLLLVVPAVVVLLAPRQRKQLLEYGSYFRLRPRSEGTAS